MTDTPNVYVLRPRPAAETPPRPLNDHLSVRDAQTQICAAMRPLGHETVGLADALGRVLAADIVARVSHPPMPVSAMDGYALRTADATTLPATLKKIGISRAGHGYEGEVRPGTCVRIFTGAPIPAGADMVALQEDAEEEEGDVLIHAVPPVGRFVRPAGTDIVKGATVLATGRRLTARDIGLVALAGHVWVTVRRRPKVAIVSTGDEVAAPGEALGPDQIFGSNGPALMACVKAWGGDPLDLGIVPDRLEALSAMVDLTGGADLLVSSGGVSTGDHDLVQQGLVARGLAVAFWKIDMRPGKPLMFGQLGATAVLGLPGNPVSALVCAHLFLQPALETMLGLEQTAAPPETAVLTQPLPANDGRVDYLRATIARHADGTWEATPFAVQDSVMLADLAAAGGLIRRLAHAPPAAVGDRVEVIRFEGGLLSY